MEDRTQDTSERSEDGSLWTGGNVSPEPMLYLSFPRRTAEPSPAEDYRQ